jgi:hypothetical protein
VSKAKAMYWLSMGLLVFGHLGMVRPTGFFDGARGE